VNCLCFAKRERREKLQTVRQHPNYNFENQALIQPAKCSFLLNKKENDLIINWA